MASLDLKNVTTIGTEGFRRCDRLVSFDSKRVRVIPSAALSDCKKLKTIILQNVDSIKSNAFYKTDKIDTIQVCTAVPPVIEAEDAFEALAYQNATVYVPVGCKKAYAEAPYWKNFVKIVESEELTAIEKIVGGTVEAGNVYGLNGKLVKKGAVSTKGLPKGIYIMNGKKVMVR